MTGWRKWLLLVWLAAAGGLLAFLPSEWIGADRGWRFWLAALVLVGIAYGLATAAMTLATRRRARRRIAAPVEVTLAHWGDHIEATVGKRRLVVACEAIAAVAVGREHLFIDAPPEVLIVPRRAFAEVNGFVAFGEDLDRLSRRSAS